MWLVGGACDDREVRVSVLIVDDHEEFRNSARALLQADGYAVVGEARDGAEAIAEAERLRPEIVLLGIQLPGIDGFAVAERLASWAHPPGRRPHLEPRRPFLWTPAGQGPGARVSEQGRSFR